MATKALYIFASNSPTHTLIHTPMAVSAIRKILLYKDIERISVSFRLLCCYITVLIINLCFGLVSS